MKNKFIAIALFIAGMNYAQIKFENGYFIKNSGEKVNALIKNLDWKNNPTEFEYKTNENDQVQKENIKNILEFGIDNGPRYVKKVVMVDYSTEDVSTLSQDKNPEFQEKTLFLKYLVDGKASLYYYEAKNLSRYFYSSDNSDIKQLVYKMYSLDNNQVAYNNDYKNQISNDLKCGITEKEIQNLNYRRSDLIKVFTQYNQCSNSQFVDYTIKNNDEKRDFINLNIKAGVRSISAYTDFYNPYISPNKVDFDNKAAFSIGLEVEAVLPFNKNKWAVFAEPTYQYYKSSKDFIINENTDSEKKATRAIEYKSIEVPVGIRHYFFLNDKSKLFANAAVVFDIGMGNSVVTSEYDPKKIKSSTNFAFGGGYKYNDKFILEFRVSTPRNLFTNSNTVGKSNYNSISLLLGYTLF
ncbi:tRNA modification GTPase [Chryseobacterium sp. NRRL B-14859]|uniref:tRNA modification GTPase n=1 Tax=Chryseobacterium sp. NRRL B-14859 TaxID=1562763 RepID=UPI0033929E38